MLPVVTILLGSLSPLLPVIASAPLLPPLGFIMFIAWRLARPGLLPLWAGVPFGLFDDLFSGQPLGSAILLWSLTMLAVELIEARFPWRNFFQDWLLAILLIAFYLLSCSAITTLDASASRFMLLVPQFAFSVVAYPIASRFVSIIDRLRLVRFRTS